MGELQHQREQLRDLKKNEGGVSPVPEPSTWAMLLAGLAFVAYRGRRFARARTA